MAAERALTGPLTSPTWEKPKTRIAKETLEFLRKANKCVPYNDPRVTGSMGASSTEFIEKAADLTDEYVFVEDVRANPKPVTRRDFRYFSLVNIRTGKRAIYTLGVDHVNLEAEDYNSYSGGFTFTNFGMGTLTRDDCNPYKTLCGSQMVKGNFFPKALLDHGTHEALKAQAKEVRRIFDINGVLHDKLCAMIPQEVGVRASTPEDRADCVKLALKKMKSALSPREVKQFKDYYTIMGTETTYTKEGEVTYASGGMGSLGMVFSMQCASKYGIRGELAHNNDLPDLCFAGPDVMRQYGVAPYHMPVWVPSRTTKSGWRELKNVTFFNLAAGGQYAVSVTPMGLIDHDKEVSIKSVVTAIYVLELPSARNREMDSTAGHEHMPRPRRTFDDMMDDPEVGENVDTDPEGHGPKQPRTVV